MRYLFLKGRLKNTQ